MTTLQPLISFVVVTHDRSIELVENRIIRSIATQDYQRLELVLVGEECQHLGDLVSRVQQSFPGLRMRWTNVSRPQNGLSYPWGLVARCRNLGVSLAQGEFISCQDDDNELESDFAVSLIDV